MQGNEVLIDETMNSLYPDLLASDSTSREKYEPLSTIEEYGKTCINLTSNIIPTQKFCANGLSMAITPLNERKILVVMPSSLVRI